MAILANCLLSKRVRKQCNRRKPKTFYALITSAEHKTLRPSLIGRREASSRQSPPDSGCTQTRQFSRWEVLVTENRSGLGTDYEKASNVTQPRWRTCHAAIIAREIGVPAIVGCSNATDVLKTGQEVTISCARGRRTFTRDYCPRSKRAGELAPHSHQNFMNVGNPGEAFVCYSQRWVG